jgi:uncharacterized protein YegP (UPF0339 family)
VAHSIPQPCVKLLKVLSVWAKTTKIYKYKKFALNTSFEPSICIKIILFLPFSCSRHCVAGQSNLAWFDSDSAVQPFGQRENLNMRNSAHLIALGTALALLVATPILTIAQDTKKPVAGDKASPKKDSSAKTEPKKTSTGTIQITEGKDGKFRYKLVDADNKFIFGALTGYESKEDAAKGVQNMKDVLSTAKITYPPKAIESEKKSEPAKKKNS